MEFDATFLIAAISFIVFVFIMNAVLYSPVMKIMQERDKVVENNLKKTDEISKETQQQEKYHSSELDLSRNNARLKIDAEMQKLKAEKSKIVSDYKSELYTNIQLEKDNLKQSAIQAKEVLKENVVDIAKNISGIILGDNINNQSINKSQIHIKEEQV